MMRILLGILVCLLIAASPAPAAEKKPDAHQRAEEVVAAFESEDAAALKALAANSAPGPWIVADELCARGAFDAAVAFAKAAPQKSQEPLAAYVESRRDKPEPAVRKIAVAIQAALARQDGQAVLELAAGVKGPLDSVPRIRIASSRGVVLLTLGRIDGGMEVMLLAAQAAQKIGWLDRAAQALHFAGVQAYRAGDRPAAAIAWTRCLAVEREIGNALNIVQAISNLCVVQQEMGEARKALMGYKEVLKVMRKVGDERTVGDTLNNMGNAHRGLGELKVAVERHAEALALRRKLRDPQRIAQSLHNMAIAKDGLGEPASALKHLHEALELRQGLGDVRGVEETRSVIAGVTTGTGRYGEALGIYEALLRARRERRDLEGVASTLDGMGQVLERQGHYAEALASYAESLELRRRLKLGPQISYTLTNMGEVLRLLGNYDQAREHYRESLALSRAMGDKATTSTTLTNLGLLVEDLGDDEKALEHYTESAAIAEEIGAVSTLLHALGNVGVLQMKRGDHDKALESHNRVLALSRESGDKAGEIATLSNIGHAHVWRGDAERAAAAFEEALKLVEDAPHRDVSVRLFTNLALLELLREDPAKAVDWVDRALVEVADLSTGLAEGEGAVARDAHSGLFDIAYRAALRAGDSAALLRFLEQGRAGSLRESIGSRAALEAVSISKRGLAALNAARQTTREALIAYKRARRARGGFAALRQARAAWNAARAEVGRVARDIEREQKRAAAITLAIPDDLAAIQGYLAPGEALVYYALTAAEGVALVVRRSGSRAVALPKSATIQAAAEALLAGERSVDVAQLPALRALVIEPLGLDEDVTRVLVSPMGILGYVPFALLLPKREVAYAPSGTTHGLLKQDASLRGEQVFALGDPDYGTTVNRRALAVRAGGVARLAALPATKQEVEAVGDVRRLGAEATETALDVALGKRERWRAVHFACHGLANAEHPLLSALAVTADHENDGFLTALEIMQMKIPSDLVVMSACETGKGRIYKTEGVLGLTRSFMFAGSPRVLCSLWKVDDEATRALMIKFYELWNPKEGKGPGAAAALKQAQAFIRGHDKWKHPYFWAAWVLWGLPD